MRRLAALAALAAFSVLLAVPGRLPAQAPGSTGKDVRYVRDAEEYATLMRQVYRVATRAVEAAARQQPRGAVWAVVLDIDETTLDNSAYQLERATYNLPFDDVSWDAYVNRRESGVVPGVQDFIAAVRRLGGRVAWITNRDSTVRAATRENLARFGLWSDADLLCLQDDAADTKAVRRAAVTSGAGACAWAGHPASVVAYFGDSMGDFPQAGENDPDAGSDAAFGTRFFVLPNPMYGSWERRPTRRR